MIASVDTYPAGQTLGCPDCAARRDHACPYLWTLALPAGAAAWVLRRLRAG